MSPTIAVLATVFLGPWLLVALVGLACLFSLSCRHQVGLFLFGSSPLSDAAHGRRRGDLIPLTPATHPDK